jgi:hypothetical protein
MENHGRKPDIHHKTPWCRHPSQISHGGSKKSTTIIPHGTAMADI